MAKTFCLSPRASRSLSGKVVVLVVVVVVLVVVVVVLVVVLVVLVTHSKNSLPDKTKVAHLSPVAKTKLVILKGEV